MKKWMMFMIFIGVLLPTATYAGVNVWTCNGPYGGIILNLAVDQETPNVVYAATLGGGVFRSMNWGLSWETINNGLTDHNVYSLAIDPSDHQTIYAGTSGQGIFKSTDGGNSWVPANNGLSGTEFFGLVIDPQSTQTVYAGGNGQGIFKSTNGGGTWRPVNSGLSTLYVFSLAIDPVNPNRLYAGTYDGGIFRSTDGAGTWQPCNTGLPNLQVQVHSLSVDPVVPDIIYAGTDLSGIFKSTDAGESWTLVTTAPLITWVHSLIVEANDHETVFAASGSGVYKSLDGGASWTCQFQGMWDLHTWCLALDSRNPQTIYAGNWGRGIFRSTDGGENWLDCQAGLAATMIHAVVTDPTIPGLVYAGGFGGVFKSTDGGTSWGLTAADFEENVQDLVIDPTNGLNLYAGGLFGFYKSIDGAGSFSAATTGLPDGYVLSVAIDPAAPQTLYAGLETHNPLSGAVYKSTDAGANWSPTGSGLPTEPVMDVVADPTNPQIIYAVLWSGGLIYKSIDGGLSWGPANAGILGGSGLCLAVDPASPLTLYSGTDDGIYKSTNGGISWESKSTGLTNTWIESIAINPSATAAPVLYAGSYSGLFKSSNGGNSWSPENTLMTNTQVHSLTITGEQDKVIYAGTGGGVFVKAFTTRPVLNVFCRTGQAGTLNPDLPSQILPASSLVFTFEANSFPEAASGNPVIIELQLPAGAVLSQTLATGNLTMAAPSPMASGAILPLAVSEYMFNPRTQTYEPGTSTAGTATIPADAVQLLRYVAGETKIWVRLTCSTRSWQASAEGNVFGFSLGVGSGVWPPNNGSNWGRAGCFSQGDTQFFADIRAYDFAANQNKFPLAIQAFYQNTGQAVPGLDISPSSVELFRLDQRTSDYSANSTLGSSITSFCTADLDGDGIEDLITVDSRHNQLNWGLGTTGGTFHQTGALELPGVQPVRVDAADVNGDGRPEILVWDAAGSLRTYSWNSLFPGGMNKRGRAEPSWTITVNGTPTVSASTVMDLNVDGLPDYLYTDSSGNTLNVLFGPLTGSPSPVTYPTGGSPAALAAADFNGDTAIDVAVANASSNSVTIYLNNGSGHLTPNEILNAGTAPVDIKAADFDRDGQVDLVTALRSDKAIAVWKGLGNGTFNTTSAQKVYFVNTPSAIQVDNFDGLNGADVLVGFSDYYKLALCTVDTSGTLTHAYNINTLGDMELDSVNHVILTEDNIINVAGGTSIGGVCQRSGVTALGQLPVNLVHIPRSQDLSFSVVNLGSSSTLLNLELYDDSGSLKHAVSQPIQPSQQFVRYMADPNLFGNDANSSTRWVRGFLTQEKTYGFWLANDGAALTYMDGLKLPTVRDAKSRFVLPVVRTGAGVFTRVMLINPSRDPAQITVKVVTNGVEKASKSLNLNGRARSVLEISSEFPTAGDDDFLLVQADKPIIGSELFNNGVELAALDGLRTDTPAGVLYCPHIASGNIGINYQSILQLVNASSQAATLTLTLADDTGAPFGAPVNTTLSPLSQHRWDVATLFGLTSPRTGYVTVNTNGAAGIAGCIIFGENSGRRLLSSLPLLTPNAGKYIVGHIANGQPAGSTPFFTGLAILNPDSAARNIVLTAYRADGNILGTTTFSIPAHGRSVFMLDQKLPSLANIFGGYLIIENQAPAASGFMVFALFGDRTTNFLSAIPAEAVQ